MCEFLLKQKLMNDLKFNGRLLQHKKFAWNTFIDVVQGFFGNKEQGNDYKLVKNLLESYK